MAKQALSVFPSPCGRGWGRGDFGDGRQNALKIFEDFVIPETQNRVAQGAQIGVARLITFEGASVLAAVEFDDEPEFGADEVHDVGADGLLTAELVAIHLAVAQLAPEQGFGIGGLAAQLFGQRRQAVVHAGSISAASGLAKTPSLSPSPMGRETGLMKMD